MKAVVYTRYGPPSVLQLTDVPTPVPRQNEVLVKVHAVSLNLSDWEGLRGKPAYARLGGLFRPRGHILGSDIAGTVEAVGRDAVRFKLGEAVFADILSYKGGFAEYVCVPEKVLAPIPAGMTFEDAACLPQAGAIALSGIGEKGQVQPGQKVLINGAGGGSGMYAIQIAKLRGAEVTGVDNAEKLESMRSLGADHVLDYRQVDFAGNGLRYDLILDLVASRSPFACRRSLTRGGRYLAVGGPLRTGLQILLIGPLTGIPGRKKIGVLAVRLGVHNIAPIVELCRTGKVATHIDRRFALSQAAEALQYLGEGHAKGKVVILVE
jgi:NADPH:quinone reductase-like Zn-dependent oxidoreductase